MTNNEHCHKKENINELCDVMTIIMQSNRLQIICLLLEKGEQCVCEVQKILGLKPNITSHHLNTLKNIGIIKKRKEGQWSYYSINIENFEKVKENLKLVFNF